MLDATIARALRGVNAGRWSSCRNLRLSPGGVLPRGLAHSHGKREENYSHVTNDLRHTKYPATLSQVTGPGWSSEKYRDAKEAL